MLETWCIYSIMLLLTISLTKIAERLEKRKYFIYAGIILSLVSGLRAFSVGLDTVGYVNQCFKMIETDNISRAYGFEKSFIYICKFILTICDNYSFVLTVLALLTNILIVLRIWDFRNYINITVSTFVYFSVFYFYSMNIVRQMCAVAIIFFVTRFISEKKYVYYTIGVGIAFLFHTSAIVGLAAFILEFRFWQYLKTKQKIILIFGTSLIPILLPKFQSSLDTYTHYLSNGSLNLGLMIIIKFIMLLVSCLIFERISFETDSEKIKYNNLIISTRFYYFVGLIFVCFGYMFYFVDRMGLYFYIFETIYFGMLSKKGKYSQMWSFYAVMIGLYYLITGIMANSQGQGNYMFIWQVS